MLGYANTMTNIPSTIQMIQQLVAQPSVSSSHPGLDQGNVGVVSLLAQWLEELGFAVAIQHLPHLPDKANMVATLGAGPGGLVLAGHTDTVPCNPELWHSDPFVAVIRDERIHGLGSCDMKGFLALAVTAAASWADRPPRHPLTIVATADEETGMDGARLLHLTGCPGMAVVLGEPTGMKPVRMHKGIMQERVVLEGVAGHSSNPALGRNAIDGMAEVLETLLRYRREMGQRFVNPAFAVQEPTMNMGYIHGGDNPNRICPRCELHFDVRLNPGMDASHIRSTLQELLHPIAERLGLLLTMEPLSPAIEPMETSAAAPIVRAIEALTGTPAGTVAFATEAPFFNAMGCQSIVFGPGRIETAHQANEYLELATIDPMLHHLNTLIRRFCYEPI